MISSSSKENDVIIIGGGVSGLASCYRLQKKKIDGALKIRVFDAKGAIIFFLKYIT